jgi:hypothetical protein
MKGNFMKMDGACPITSCPPPPDERTAPAAPSPASAGTIRNSSSELCICDVFGRWKARWGIGRKNYSVDPGLYRIGTPDRRSPVFVTANYKMTFDLLRKELGGVNAWILVLDTRGINVWCAAGKGTFGTEELVGRIKSVGLAQKVENRTLIIPQLGAPGIAAHEVAKRSGFRVVYGPVYARDIKKYLESGLKASPEMRNVHFGLKERLVLIPMEFVPALKFVPLVFGILVLLRLPGGKGVDSGIWNDFLPYLGAIAAGSIVFQILLPWIPGRSFALKGWLLGLAWAVSTLFLFQGDRWLSISNMLVLPMLTSFIALNFTGATTFTSLSGVKKEMRFAVPVTLAAAAVGLLVRIIPH